MEKNYHLSQYIVYHNSDKMQKYYRNVKLHRNVRIHRIQNENVN